MRLTHSSRRTVSTLLHVCSYPNCSKRTQRSDNPSDAIDLPSDGRYQCMCCGRLESSCKIGINRGVTPSESKSLLNRKQPEPVATFSHSLTFFQIATSHLPLHSLFEPPRKLIAILSITEPIKHHPYPVCLSAGTHTHSIRPQKIR